MEDHLHIEWSTETINIIVALCTALAKAKISAPRKLSNARLLESASLNIPVAESQTLAEFALVLKLDITNTNIFVCNNYNGEWKRCFFFFIFSVLFD